MLVTWKRAGRALRLVATPVPIPLCQTDDPVNNKGQRRNCGRQPRYATYQTIHGQLGIFSFWPTTMVVEVRPFSFEISCHRAPFPSFFWAMPQSVSPLTTV